jgi:hypothetical protein
MKIFNGVDLQGQRATNLADPVASTDAATKNYVENFVNGKSFKSAVRAVATGNINLAAPGATIDGVALTSGDPILGRFLAAGQTTASQNGLYIWNGAAAAATRTTDADTNGELLPGTTVYVTEGTNADKQFAITSDAAITIGTTAMTWTIVGSGGNTYTGSNGILLTATNFTAVADPVALGGITVTAAGIKVDATVVARKASASIGTGALTVIPVTHNLGTKDVVVSLRDVATDTFGITDWVATDINTVTFTFAVAPTTNQYRVSIFG